MAHGGPSVLKDGRRKGPQHTPRGERELARRSGVSRSTLQRAKRIEARLTVSDQIVGLRRAVVEYHSSAIGHGVLFQKLEERVRHLEKLAGVSAPDQH